MGINRRQALGLLTAAGAGSRAALAQISPPSAQPSVSPSGAAQARTPDVELQIARQERLRDAQRLAAVKLPPSTEPAFRFQP